MKIALIILHADPARGGAERYTVDLVAALRQRGHAARIVSTSFAPAHDSALDVHIDPGRGSRSRRYLRFLQRVEAHLSTERYDIVHAMLPVRHCDIYHPHAGLAADAVANGHRKYEGAFLQTLSRVATRLNRRRQLFARVERKLLLASDGPLVLCLSNYVKQTVRAHYPIDEARMPVLINAVNLTRFDPAARPGVGAALRQQYGIDAEKIVFLMIAQDFERKGLVPTIQAVSRIDDQRLMLLVVGRDKAAPYASLAKQLDLSSDWSVSDRIIFAGPTTDPYPFYQAADVFVLPTRHDPCSLVVLEALAMGVPVISTKCNGATEVMTDRVHGTLLPDLNDKVALARAAERAWDEVMALASGDIEGPMPPDPGAVSTLRRAIKNMLDPATRSAMARACIELRPRLAYETHVEHLLEIYQRVLTQRGDRHEHGNP